MRERRTKYISVSLSLEEVAHLAALVAASGKTRNRYLRDLLTAQKVEKK